MKPDLEQFARRGLAAQQAVDTVLATHRETPAISRLGICRKCHYVRPLVEGRCPLCREPRRREGGAA